jgi:YHS domain-containing protein
MVIDPVCQMEFDPAQAAATLTYGDEIYFFCSTECRDRFLAEPSSWLQEEEDDREMEDYE